MSGKEYPKTLVVIRDCHAKNNLVVTAHNEADESMYRKMAERKKWKVAVRRRRAAQEPTCDNCASMEILQHTDGTNHRWCDLHGQWIPDTEQSPVCDLHTPLRGAFKITLTPAKGGKRGQGMEGGEP